MKKGIFQLVLIFLIFLIFILFSMTAFSAELKAINFSQRGEISEIEFALDSNEVEATKFQIKEDKQIIVDLGNTHTTDRIMKALDTSQFAGGVVFVKAYKKPKVEKDIRVAIQLRDNVRSVLIRKPNKVILQIENRFGVFTQKQAEEGQTYQDATNEASLQRAGKLNVAKSESLEDILENIVQSGRKKYIGKKITMNLKNAIPMDILRMLADNIGFNLVLSDDVKSASAVSLNLVDTPWDQVLDTVLDLSKLVAKKNGIILIVSTVDAAIKEEKTRKEASAITKEQEPILSRIFPISFADLGSIATIIGEYTTEKRGKISQDKRTNSLIVKDTEANIEKMKKIIELLDTQTPQILIEAKIVEVAEKYQKELGLVNGLSFGYDPFSAPGPNAGTFSMSSATDGGRSLFGVNILKYNRLMKLDFNIKMMESEGHSKIISSPKVITKNNVPASITQSESAYYAETTQGTQAGAPVTTTYKSQSSDLSLKVTPQVTNEGSINMQVSVSKGSLGAQSTVGAPKDSVSRSVSTEVLVDNGSTIVIGGVYTYLTSEAHSGIPFLKDIPIVGWLFRTYYNPTVDKKELIIFLSPRIINQDEAGLTDKG